MIPTAKAHWVENLKEGKRTLSMQNNVLESTNYSFIIHREEDEKRINSEEFETITKDAEQNCLISKGLNIPITSNVHFEF